MLPAGLGRNGFRALYTLGLLSALRAVALVVLAESLARGIVAVISATGDWQTPLVVGIAAAAVRGGAGWATQSVAARAALGVKEAVRRDLAERVVRGGEWSVGELTALATRGIDDLDNYFSRVFPAVTGVAVVPLVVGARILFADWVSALIVVLTVPLVPIFLALIGMHTRDRVDAASAALIRLSEHLIELARGLPVLVGLGRVEEQTAALERVSADYRTRTMATLRTAFLSSLALELISTISVAVVAVFIGFRLVDGSLPLEIGLLVLILAPECFTPFRDLGTAYHASQDGIAALGRARAIIQSPQPALIHHAGSELTVRGLTVHYQGRLPALTGLDFDVPAREITAICGASGSGKSTILAALAGVLNTGGAVVEGRVTGVDPSRVAWVPQHPHTIGDTVRDELRSYGGHPDRIAELLHEFRFAQVADADPAQLSPGELRRVAVARAMLRIDAGARLVLLDEPTAHLDDETSAIVVRAIEAMRGRVTVVVASHDPSVVALAKHSVWLGDPRTQSESPARSPVTDADWGGLPGADYVPDPASTPDPEPVEARPSQMLRLAGNIVRPAAVQLTLSIVLGVLAALFGVALTAVSGWLIVRASQQPAIMYLLVAIVGVRFFGIGRSVLRYAERLMTHDAVFVSVSALRTRLWRALAERGASSRRLLRGGTALDYLIGCADQVRDLAPRVLLPPIVGAVTGLASLVAVAVLLPAALPLLAACLVLCLVVAPVTAVWADRRASVGRSVIRSTVLRRFAVLVASAGELRANGVDTRARADLHDLDRRAGIHARRSARALGLGGAVVIFACSATAVAMLAVSASAVRDGLLPGEVVAVLVLVPLALIDPLLGVVDAAQQWSTFTHTLGRIARFTPSPLTRQGGADVAATVTGIELRDLSARWSGATRPAFDGVSAAVTTGEWLTVTGPSGSGKSTLLTVLLGYLSPSTGDYLLGKHDSRALDPRAIRRHVAWCPQEGHLFDSTLRANLRLSRARGDEPSEPEMLDALRLAGLREFTAGLGHGLETRIGAGGERLSGGERQRVAVARTLLSRAEVVLLDEPTAHLDAATAATLMVDLRVALRDRLTVLVTHAGAQSRPWGPLAVHLPPQPLAAPPPLASETARAAPRSPQPGPRRNSVTGFVR